MNFSKKSARLLSPCPTGLLIYLGIGLKDNFFEFRGLIWISTRRYCLSLTFSWEIIPQRWRRRQYLVASVVLLLVLYIHGLQFALKFLKLWIKLTLLIRILLNFFFIFGSCFGSIFPMVLLSDACESWEKGN
jgi:hypothetical protein